MARTPTDSEKAAEDTARKKSAEDDALLREVDEALRQSEMEDAAKKFGVPILAALVLGLLAFGGYLFWDNRQTAAQAEDSEELVKALDQLEAGNVDTANSSLEGLLADGSPGSQAAAQLLAAGIALEQNRPDDAIAGFAALAADESAPEAFRNLATIRELAANFENVEPSEVIDRLKPLATPGNPYFGSAGELVGMAYLKQDREDLAGPLFAEIAKDEDVPESLRSRARQLAGVLGVDAIEDVDTVISEAGGETAAEADALEE